MLLAIRDRITGAIAWVICIIIIVPFALWGITEYIGVGTEPAAVKFNDTELSMREFERRTQLNRQQLAQRFGGKIPEVFDNSDLLRQQTANQFIDREALVQYVKKNKYGSSGEEVYRNITALPQFQLDGQFSPETYERQVSSLGYSKRAFEQQVGLDIAIGQLQQGLVATSLVVEEQLKDYVSLRNQSRDFEYLILDINNYKKKVQLSDTDSQAYYDERKASLVTERQVALNYIELKLADLAKGIEVDEQTLQDLYDSNAIPGIADKPETRKASHILLLVDETASADEVVAKETEIQSIRSRALTEDFATLAKELSEDAGSAPTGGDLGDVARGVMVKPFEDALFAMQEGSISDVVKTQFGFHIIKLAKINVASKPPFAEVKTKIETAYKNQEAEKLFFEKADQLANLTFEQPDNLDAAADELGITVQITPLFTESVGAGIATNEKVRTKAFSDELLKEGVNSEAIEMADNHVVFIRAANYQPSREKTFAEAKPEIEATLLNVKARELAQADLDAAFAEATDNQWSELAKKYAGELKKVEKISRDDSEVNTEIVEQAFLLTEIDPTVKVSLNDGSVALLKLQARHPGDLAALSSGEKQQAENEWLTMNGRSDFEKVLAAYKEKAEVDYHPDLNIVAEK